MMLTFTAVPVSALTSGYYTYEVTNGEATITRCDTSISGKITIPETLGGYPVTSIGNSAFYSCQSLTSVTIPESVTSIGDSAFGGCRVLKSATIPDSVTSIGKSAFKYCYSLTSVAIPDSVTNIGDKIFYMCESLRTATIGNGVTSIGEEAFEGCEWLSTVTLGENVTSIGNSAFHNCSLTSINFPEGLTSIGDSAFVWCSLYSIKLPDSLTYIGDSAFYCCVNLSTVTIGSGVTSVGYRAFRGCRSLASIIIPNNVTSVGREAFYECKKLDTVTISDSVTNIDSYAFYGCDCLATANYMGSKTEWKSISIATGNEDLLSATINMHRVTYKFVDDDGSVLKETTVTAGSEIIPPENPEKGATDQYTYTFAGWDGYTEGMNATEDITFKASYNAFVNQYTYKFLDEDGSVLKEKTVDYGTEIIPPENPIKASTQQYSYPFLGWSGYTEGMTLKEDVTFTAMYDTLVNECTYIFMDEDGTVLIEETVDYGTEIIPPENPIKASTQQYSYPFLGWSGYTEGMTLEEDVTFTAMYDTLVNQYTYKFVDEDGTVLIEETVDYGTEIILPETPEKAGTQQHSYPFMGWSGYAEGMTLEEDVTFTAMYDTLVNQYTYKFLDEDGNVLKEERVDYGTEIIPPEIADKEAYYLFDSWEGYTNGMMLTENVSFTAVFKYKDYAITAEGLTQPVTATYNSHFTIPVQEKETYRFVGYFAESGEQITNEKGESLSPYHVADNLAVYPRFVSIYMNKIEVSGTETAIIGEQDVKQQIVFATDEDVQYLVLTVKYPETLVLSNVSAVDFAEVSKDSEVTKDGYTYASFTCVYDYNGGSVPKNEMVVPFELSFDVPTTAEIGTAAISIEEATLIGNGNFPITERIENVITIMPKLAESIHICGSAYIDAPTKYTVKFYPDYTTNQEVFWSVSDETVATVSQDGVLTPMKNGTVTLTVSAMDGSGAQASGTVHVTTYAKLDDLKIHGGLCLEAFHPDVRNYTVYAKEDATSISLTPTFTGGVLRPNGSGIWISGREKEFELTGDETVITLLRENVDGNDAGVYTITVIRCDAVEVSTTEDGKTFDVNLAYAKEGTAVVLALYQDGALVETQIATYSGEYVSFTTEKEYTNAKVMAWESMESLKPICDAEIVK